MNNHASQWQSIQKALQGEGEGAELKNRGIIVENFVIEHIALDPKYIDEIKGKQIATQKSLRAVEEQKAAEAQALVAKSLAQADFNTKVVEAERQKKETIIRAEGEKEKAITQATAEQQKLILEAEGTKTSQIAIAEGVIAMGKATAEAQKLKLSAYAVPGAEAFTRIEISKNMATAFSGIKGYLPNDMKINVLAENFAKALDMGTGNPIIQLDAPKK